MTWPPICNRNRAISNLSLYDRKRPQKTKGKFFALNQNKKEFVKKTQVKVLIFKIEACIVDRHEKITWIGTTSLTGEL